MDCNQELLVKFLSKAIRNQNSHILYSNDIDWESIFYEAKKHDVQTLLYPVFKEFCMKYDNNNILLSTWRKSALMEGVNQLQQIEEAAQIIKHLNIANISVIALKGLILRNLYPKPELRTMTDVDLLVQNKDLKHATAILLQRGYFKEGISGKHISFQNENYLTVELHNSLFGYEIKNILKFDKEVWSNTDYTEICGIPVLSLKPKAQLIHLCLHMATHFICGGFGLRQLCDLTLFVERFGENIDWTSFCNKLKDLGIEKFTNVIFLICNKLLEMELPYYIDECTSNDFTYISLFVDDILNGGTFGKSTMSRAKTSIWVRNSLYSRKYKYNSFINYLFLLLFPPFETLSQNYSYCKRSRFLIPIAWIHRLTFGIFRKGLSLNEKISFTFNPPDLSEVAARKNLIQWLDLI